MAQTSARSGVLAMQLVLDPKPCARKQLKDYQGCAGSVFHGGHDVVHFSGSHCGIVTGVLSRDANRVLPTQNDSCGTIFDVGILKIRRSSISLDPVCIDPKTVGLFS